MKPERIGRVLGVGVRVAGRVAGESLKGSGQPNPNTGATAAQASRSAGQAAGRATKGLARGVGGFLRPFGHVGRVVLLEVIGVFFFLFVFVFARNVWSARASYAHGPDHVKFLISVGLMLVFLYLSVTSFMRARKK